MEDIRFNKEKIKLDNSIKFSKILLYLKKNWWKIILITLALFIIIFPTISGHLLGSWWNNFASSFIQKLTF